MRILCIIAITFISSISFAQNTFRAVIKDDESNEPLPGASAQIANTGLGVTANQVGIVEIQNVPNGTYTIEFSFVGHQPHTVVLTFPLASSEPVEVTLEVSEEE